MVYTPSELVDDTRLMFQLLQAALPDVNVVQELWDSAHDNLPILLFDMNGSDAEYQSNGPGLWLCVLDLWVFAKNEEAAWELTKRVHQEVAGWDFPGTGYVPGLGGIERSETIAKFNRPFASDMFDKTVSQSQAAYSLLVRNTY